MFNEDFEAIEETLTACVFEVPSSSQKVYFINLQEIKDIAFGTPNPINYFDTPITRNCICAPTVISPSELLTQLNLCGSDFRKNMDHVSDCGYSEAVHCGISIAFKTAVNKMSMDGIRILRDL